MTRALPLDLAAVAESEGAVRANASLRLQHWATWGDGWTAGAAEKEAREIDALVSFESTGPLFPIVNRLAGQRQARARARAEVMRAAGWTVRKVRIDCCGPVLALLPGQGASCFGFSLDRNTGLPCMPASRLKRMLQAGIATTGSEDAAERAARNVRLYGECSGASWTTGAIVVFDALPVSLPSIVQMKWDARWAPQQLAARVTCISRPTEFEFWIAARDAADVTLAASEIDAVLKAAGLAGPPPVPEVIVRPPPPPEPVVVPPPEPEPVPEEITAGAVEEAASAPEPVVAVPPPPPPVEAGPTFIPEDVVTITVQVPTVTYLPNNSRVFLMFVPPGGRDAMKAEEHISTIAMTEEVRAKLKKKKVLLQAKVAVEAVGNSWRIRGIGL